MGSESRAQVLSADLREFSLFWAMANPAMVDAGINLIVTLEKQLLN